MTAGFYSTIRHLLLLLCATIFTYVFVTSGLVVSVLSIILLPVWPFAKNIYRRITSGLAYTVLGQIVWICTDYGELKVHMFCDKTCYEKFGRESCILTSSHRGDLDWVAGFVLGAHFGFLEAIRSLPKQSIRYVPGFGQLLWALEYPFLHRNNYKKDREAISAVTEVYRQYPFPITVAIYCEGTRFTKEKQEKGWEYARKHDLPLLKHHVTPRTKGFAVLAEHLRVGEEFKSLYDVAVAYPHLTNGHIPSHLDILLGRKIELYWYMRRIPMKELPSTYEELNTYCYKLFQHKDEAYEHFLNKGTFPAPRQPLPPFSRILWGLRLITVVWGLLLTVAPLSILYLTLPWQTMSVILSIFTSFNALLFIGLLVYAKGNTPPDIKKDD